MIVHFLEAESVAAVVLDPKPIDQSKSAVVAAAAAHIVSLVVTR